MEQAAMRLLVRDQVESLLENVSAFVPAIILFPPEQVGYIAIVSSTSTPGAHASRSSIPASFLSRPSNSRLRKSACESTSVPPSRRGDSRSASLIAIYRKHATFTIAISSVTPIPSYTGRRGGHPTDASPSNVPSPEGHQSTTRRAYEPHSLLSTSFQGQPKSTHAYRR